MTAVDATFSDADLELIQADFNTLPELCAGRDLSPAAVERMIAARAMPQPAYVLPDGRRMFPDDYFQLFDEAGGAAGMRDHFMAALERHARAAGLAFDEEWDPETEWTDYLDGTYWICLRNASPAVMITKERRIREISRLVADPKPDAAEWRAKLRDAVAALDSIERPFTDFDRARWEYTSRDRYITAVRERYPETFRETSP